jgi:hypothetical protein
LGRFLRGVGKTGEADFFILNLSTVNKSPSERMDYVFHTRKIIDQEIRLTFYNPIGMT